MLPSVDECACGNGVILASGLCLRCSLEEASRLESEITKEQLAASLQEADVPDEVWRLGNYEILGELGRGGMGVIYRARQRHSQRIVAIKRIIAFRATNKEWLERFRREIKAKASLDHPNILPIYEVSESPEGWPYYSMKFAQGGSLRDAAKSLTDKPREAVTLVAKVARAIAYAHEHGILHRDLQPGNILLDHKGEPYVCDFGLAKLLNDAESLTQTVTTLGTPGYMAPEQADGPAGQIATTADIYSLGAVLFSLLTGRPPFIGDNALSVVKQASTLEAPKLRTLAPALDRDLEVIIARCLERDSNNRYQSATELADDLERWLDALPILARPAGPLTRARRWCYKNKSVVAISAAGLLLVATSVLLLSPRWLSNITKADKSIAVLPFEDFTTTKNDSFANGVQDDILAALAKVADLKVVSRSSVSDSTSIAQQDPRAIGKQLGVAYLLKGSVRRHDDRVRINAQLIDTKTGTTRWADSYERGVTDLFAIQAEIAQRIVLELAATLSPSEKAALTTAATKDLEAFELYSRARTLSAVYGPFSKDSIAQIIGLLNSAVARDPHFVPAWCELAAAHDALYFAGYDRTPARLASAEDAIHHALALQPNAGTVRLALAQHRYRAYRDYNQARAELEKARGSLPNNSGIFELLGYIDRRQGRWSESIQNLEKASALDPRNPHLMGQLAVSYLFLHQYRKSTEYRDRILSITPESPAALISRALVEFEEKADLHPLHQVIDDIRAKSPNLIPNIAPDWFFLSMCERDPVTAHKALEALSGDDVLIVGQFSLSRSMAHGLVAKLRGDDAASHVAFEKAREELQEAIGSQPDFGPNYSLLGLVHAALGRKEEALRAGRRGMALMPLASDSMTGSDAVEFFALTCAWCGEKELALHHLEILTKTPSLVSYGQLKLHPWWDNLRGDPRFEAIVQSLARR